MDQLYKKEEQRLKEYEATSTKQMQEEQTELAYRDLNTRFTKVEENKLS